MRLIQAWEKTINFFYPTNLIFFLWITLRSIGMAYRLFFQYCWWFFILLGIFTLFAKKNESFDLFFSELLHYLFIYLFILSVRPSVKLKDLDYFRSWLPLFFPAFIGFFSIKFIDIFLISFVGLKIDQWQPIYLFFKSFTYAAQIFSILFFLDSDHSVNQLVQSFIRSIKMAIYNYPICLFFGIIFLGLEIGGSFLVGMFLFSWERVGMFLRVAYLVNKVLFVPLQLSIFSNIYIKKLYEQFDYYF